MMSRAKEMLDTLRKDFYVAWDTRNGSLGNINLDTYKKRFNVTDQEIAEYCKTLTRLVPIHPVCVICKNPWHGVSETHPTNNGHHIEWVHSFTVFCADESHNDLWYFQYADGSYSFDMEARIDNIDYTVRWNCSCAVEACRGKNVIYDADGDMVAYFDNSTPYNVSNDDLRKIIYGQARSAT